MWELPLLARTGSRLRGGSWPRAAAGVLALVVGLASLGVPGSTSDFQETGSVNPVELAAFMDSLMTEEMARERIPGAGFVFVQNGQVVLQRGYGFADVARRRRVIPDSTIWRVGSISKVFTATALMQLVDRGLVDLDAPVDRYVRRLQVPNAYPASVTVRHLLDHTAGFDEIRPGTQAAHS